MRRILILLAVLCLVPSSMLAEDTEVSIYQVAPGQAAGDTPVPVTATPAPDVPQPQAEPTMLPGDARTEFIDGMLSLAKDLFDQANGRPRRAQYAGDIYVCKNFTVHLFREVGAAYEMAAYPGVKLVIPNNLPKAQSKPYAYGIFWQDVKPEQGNPFYAAHTFTYNTDLTKEENRALALAFMRNVKKGDFFQMSANYAYGVGAHSLVFTRDYDSASNQVTWTDSNMNGVTRNGERYGYVQYDAKKDIGWFVDAFCQRTRGAVLYRLRDDIILK